MTNQVTLAEAMDFMEHRCVGSGQSADAARWELIRRYRAHEPGVKRVYWETHEAQHCPTCSCGSQVQSSTPGHTFCKACGVRDGNHMEWCPEAPPALKSTAPLPQCECLIIDKEPSAYHNEKCPRFVAGKL